MKPFRTISLPRKLLVAVAVGMLAQTAGAAIVSFTEATSPTGIFSSSSNVETTTLVSTRAATLISTTNTFTHWTLNGVRKSDASGRSLNPVNFTILEPTAAVANYMSTTLDSDVDTLPDCYEIEFFGSLIRTAASDNDGDGFSVSIERTRGMSPAVTNTLADGGISRRRGAKVLMVAPGQFTLTEVSDPVGIISSTRTVFVGTSVSLSTPPDPSSTLRFTGWFVGNQRIDSGLSLQPISFTVTSNITVVARYLSAMVDSDSDGILDWYEQFHFGNLAQGENSDSDGDGFDLSQEVVRNQAPQVVDLVSEGGISRRRSALTTVSPVNYVTYTLVSDPSGFINQSLNAVEGSEVTTQNLNGTVFSSSRFVGWEIGGIRQLDPSGAAAGSARFTAVNGLVATARFISLTADADVDSIPDWYEWFYFGNLGNSQLADPDNDGFTLAMEYNGGLSPLQTDLVNEGGISRRRSLGTTAVNLQPFERLKQVPIDGLLTQWFSEEPAVSPPQGVDLGSDLSTAFCDWDGDGDLDLFIVSAGSVSVFENIGSQFSMNLSDQSAKFGGLATLCSGISRPLIAAGDWNLDGYQDLAISDGVGNLHLVASNHVFSGSGNGSATSVFVITGGGVFPAIGDLDDDGKPDLLMASADGTISFFSHNGSSSAPFGIVSTAGMSGSIVEGISSMTIGDIDLDGRNDVLAADLNGRIWEFHRQSSGTFLLKSKVWGGSGVGFAPFPSISAGDFEGDGDIDLIGVCPDGGIFALRDPKIGRPTGLTAAAGVDSILLKWNPDSQSRIRGYHVYRSADVGLAKSRINSEIVPAASYLDENLQTVPSLHYQVTALTQAIYAGNSAPTLLESPASETVSVLVRRVGMSLEDTSGYPSSNVMVFLSIENSVGMSGQGMDLRIRYPVGLVPVTQFASGLSSVEASGLGADLTFTTNEATANGELIIQGTGGTLEPGQGKLFTLNFRVAQKHRGQAAAYHSHFPSRKFAISKVPPSPPRLAALWSRS